MAIEVLVFQHNLKQARQLMRSAIPLMVKLDIPPTPYNYGVWYEYASNRNPKFNQIVDRALRRFGGLPAFVSQELFNEYLIPEDFRYAHHQGPLLREITSTLESNTHTLTHELEAFGSTLQTAKSSINNATTANQVEQIALLLDKSTFKASQAIEAFNSALQSAQEELADLRSELLTAKRNTELDAMTLLANEKGFERSLFALSPFAEDDLTLLLIDIDNLGEINLEYGKKAGTSLIRYIAKLLLKLLPDNSFIARLNGGQFAMLLSETELSVAAEFAEKIRKEISIQKIRNKNSKVLLRQVTVSIGVATLFGDENPNELVQRAQHYLLYAKRSGKNQIAHHQ